MTTADKVKDLEHRLAKARRIFFEALALLRGDASPDEINPTDALTAEVKATVEENRAIVEAVQEFWVAASEAGWPKLSDLDAERKAELLRTLWRFKSFIHGETLAGNPGPDAG